MKLSREQLLQKIIKDDSHIAVDLYEMYLHKNNMEEAFFCLHVASSLGSSDALIILGGICEHGKFTVAIDLHKCLVYYLSAHFAKNYRGTLHVARLYEEGIGIPKNLAKAIEIYRIVVKANNNAHAQFKLGMLSTTKKESYPMLLASAKQNHTLAMVEVAKILLLQDFPEKAKAKQFLQKAVNNGNSEAKFILGTLLLSGSNRNKTPRGFQYIRAAAEENHIPALEYLKENRADVYQDTLDRICHSPEEISESVVNFIAPDVVKHHNKFLLYLKYPKSSLSFLKKYYQTFGPIKCCGKFDALLLKREGEQKYLRSIHLISSQIHDFFQDLGLIFDIRAYILSFFHYCLVLEESIYLR